MTKLHFSPLSLCFLCPFSTPPVFHLITQLTIISCVQAARVLALQEQYMDVQNEVYLLKEKVTASDNFVMIDYAIDVSLKTVECNDFYLWQTAVDGSLTKYKMHDFLFFISLKFIYFYCGLFIYFFIFFFGGGGEGALLK